MQENIISENGQIEVFEMLQQASYMFIPYYPAFALNDVQCIATSHRNLKKIK